MREFNVIEFDINRNKAQFYNVVPYFVNVYKEQSKRKFVSFGKPETFEDFKEFVRRESQYMFWGRVQYEIIITGMVGRDGETKMDIHDQIMANIDLVTEVVMEAIKESEK